MNSALSAVSETMANAAKLLGGVCPVKSEYDVQSVYEPPESVQLIRLDNRLILINAKTGLYVPYVRV